MLYWIGMKPPPCLAGRSSTTSAACALPSSQRQRTTWPTFTGGAAALAALGIVAEPTVRAPGRQTAREAYNQSKRSSAEVVRRGALLGAAPRSVGCKLRSVRSKSAPII